MMTGRRGSTREKSVAASLNQAKYHWDIGTVPIKEEKKEEKEEEKRK